MNPKYLPSDLDYLKQIGSRIRHVRERKRLTQEALAFKSKLDRTYVGSVERGQRNISILNLRKIAKALDIPLSILFEGDE